MREGERERAASREVVREGCAVIEWLNNRRAQVGTGMLARLIWCSMGHQIQIRHSRVSRRTVRAHPPRVLDSSSDRSGTDLCKLFTSHASRCVIRRRRRLYKPSPLPSAITTRSTIRKGKSRLAGRGWRTRDHRSSKLISATCPPCSICAPNIVLRRSRGVQPVITSQQASAIFHLLLSIPSIGEKHSTLSICSNAVLPLGPE